MCSSRGDRRRGSPSRSRNRVGSVGDLARAPAPSRRVASATNCCATPSVASSGSPSYSYQPCSGAMFGNSCAVRKRSISSSGLIPGSSLRKTFSAIRSSNTIELLDCSTPIGRTVGVGGRARAPSAGGSARARRRSRSRASTCRSAAAARGRSLGIARARRRRRARRRARSTPRVDARRRRERRAAAGRARACRWRTATCTSASTSAVVDAARLLDDLDAVSVCALGREPALLAQPARAAARGRGAAQIGPGSIAGGSAIGCVLSLVDQREPEEARAAEASAGTAARRSAGSACGRTSRPGSGPGSALRSSSTAWAERARLWTHRTMSSSKLRMWREDPRVGRLRSARRCRSRTPDAPCAAR